MLTPFQDTHPHILDSKKIFAVRFVSIHPRQGLRPPRHARPIVHLTTTACGRAGNQTPISVMAKGSKRPPPSAAGASSASAAAAASAITPAWPPFRPPLPVTDLAAETVVSDKVVVYRSFFPRSLARDYVAFLGGLPLTTTPGKPKRGMALRVNDRFQIDDAYFANRLWTETGLREAVADPDLAHLW